MAQLDVLKARNKDLELRFEESSIEQTKVQMRLNSELEDSKLTISQLRNNVEGLECNLSALQSERNNFCENFHKFTTLFNDGGNQL